MTAFQRRVCLVVGAVLAVVFGLAILIALRSSGWDLAAVPSTTAIAGLLLVLGSIAFLLAGRRESLGLGGRSIAWWQAAGVGLVLLGSGLAIPGLSRLPAPVGLVTALCGLAVCGAGVAELRRGPPAPEDVGLSNREATMVVGAGLLLIVAVLFVQLVFVPG